MIENKYDSMDELEIDIKEAIDVHHISNVVHYLGRLCESIPDSHVGGGNAKPFHDAAQHLNKAYDILRLASYHDFKSLYNA